MEPTQVWTPPAHQDRRAADVSKAVAEYDDRLGFGVNPRNGQWCIFMRQGNTEETRGGDLPLLGFDHIPTPDEAKKKLYETDARRHGERILNQLRQHNEQIDLKFKDAADDAIGDAAERFEHEFRKMGLHPRPRIFVPKGVKKDAV